MGGIYSRLTSPIRKYNIENRAHKIISKEKPIAAPQFPSVAQQKEIVDKLHPDFMDTAYKKDTQLDERLKSVYVSSIGSENKSMVTDASSTRPLPRETSDYRESEDGYRDPIVVPEGKCSTRQAVTFLKKYKEKFPEYTAEQIALEYKLDKQVAENIVEHFRIPGTMHIDTKDKYKSPLEMVLKANDP
ncbi:protein NDUFAF4 homolog [Colletes gigas]|uniref:protein NDUFAF4 homolog n=1 Tax=Colletes gigas TaxID=935657 RepID=UPI001C9B7775|nr:protein NDUFAF4 homolog [Colletes gigas]XP_043251719.1 protein NDUFAF4 homolog [Colletes gigas]XP_043251727.1 protein NDUFAF4 homolog [Colletes gigas]